MYNTYIILLVSGLANNRNDCVVEEQAHGEDSGETIQFQSKHGHVEGGVGVAEVDVKAPRESKVHHYPYQPKVAQGTDRVDLPESRGVHKREEEQEDEGIHQVERLLSKYRLKYGVVRFFLDQQSVRPASHVCDVTLRFI